MSPRLSILAVAAALLLGCGGSALNGRTYRSGDLAFRLGPRPEGWRHLDGDGVALMTFRNDATATSIAVNGRCGKDGDDVPLEALTQHLFIHFRDRQILSEKRMPLDGRGALRTELRARLDGVEKHFTVVVLKKDGCVYDFLRVTDDPKGGSTEAFDGFVGGFRTLD